MILLKESSLAGRSSEGGQASEIGEEPAGERRR